MKTLRAIAFFKAQRTLKTTPGGPETAATTGSLVRTARDLAALLSIANAEVGFSRGLHDTRGVLLPAVGHRL